MKKNLLLVLISVLIINFLHSQEIRINYQFEHPVFIEDANGYTELIFKNSANYNAEGLPLIPHFACEVLLPAGCELATVELVSANYSKEIYNFRLKPASKEFPISVGAPDGYSVVPDPLVYNSLSEYPAQPVSGLNTQFLAGHAIGLFNICPVKYYPADEKIQLLEEITLLVKYSPGERSKSSLKHLRVNQTIHNTLSGIVDNPDQIESYMHENYRDVNENDLLIITREDLMDDFQDYADFKTGTGFLVQLIAVEDIYNDYTGQDNQEKIRNCIIDYYDNYGTSYVILGGDSDPTNANNNIIPHRGFYAEGEYDIPSEMYYSCLDGNWNNDGDNAWGETGEYDTYAEIGIGRVCAGNPTEIENALHKLYMYQNEPVVDDIEKALMVGENLNNNPVTWGGDYKDQIAEGSSAHGFTTAGVWDTWNINYLYERDMSWNRSDVYNEFNTEGTHLLNHLGHSNTTYNMKMYNEHLTTANFTNNGVTRGYAIGYSQGCYNGSFDNRTTEVGSYTDECFAETFQTLETGEVACIANSRYGWYSPANTNSSSQYHDRQFFDAIFGEAIYHIGWVNSDAVADNASYMGTWGLMRWVAYEANLFGDPSMDIWTSVPSDIIASYPASIPMGIVEINIQTDAPFARIGLLQNGELIGRGIADEAGDIILSLFEPLSQPEMVHLSIIAHDKNRHQDSIVVVSDEPYVIHHNHQYNDPTGNGNGIIDYNETIQMTLEMKNVGNEPATNVEVTISCNDGYVTLTDSTEIYGNFDAGQVISIENGFEFHVAENVPDEHNFTFRIEAVGEENWVSYTNGMACAPVLLTGNYTIDDSENGNGNGFAEAGETINLIIPAINNGHSVSPEGILYLASDCEYLTLMNHQFNVGSIAPESSNDAIFTIEIDENTPIGTFANFISELNAGIFSSESTFALKIGFIMEDWESGGFDTFNWLHSGNAFWAICEEDPFEGAYCIQSGPLNDLQKSRLFIAVDVLADDSISFYRKVSSEEDYDYLYFYIDVNSVDQWAGELDWERVSFHVTEGMHMFQWIYEKDTYVAGGEDCAWIDFISLPVSDGYFVGMDENPLSINTTDAIAYPNPFKENLTIIFNLETQDNISIAVYNTNGRQLASLENNTLMNKGMNTVIWNGKDAAGNNLPSGLFYIKIQGNNFVKTLKLMRLDLNN